MLLSFVHRFNLAMMLPTQLRRTLSNPPQSRRQLQFRRSAFNQDPVPGVSIRIHFESFRRRPSIARCSLGRWKTCPLLPRNLLVSESRHGLSKPSSGNQSRRLDAFCVCISSGSPTSCLGCSSCRTLASLSYQSLLFFLLPVLPQCAGSDSRCFIKASQNFEPPRAETAAG